MLHEGSLPPVGEEDLEQLLAATGSNNFSQNSGMFLEALHVLCAFFSVNFLSY